MRFNSLPPHVQAKLKAENPDVFGSPPKRRHKYNVAPVEDRTSDGKVFDSKHEKNVAGWLRTLFRGKIEYQVPFVLIDKCPDAPKSLSRETKYVADFVLDGTYVVDAKGMLTPEFRLKSKLFYRRYGKAIINVKTKGDVIALLDTIQRDARRSKETN